MSAERQLVGGDLLHSVENGVAWIKLNRPDAANALTPDQRNAMIELLQSCDEDRSVRVVVLGATGRHFCGGADLRIDRPELDATGLTPTGTLTGAVTKTITYGVHKLIAALQDCHKPVVASVHGTAAGVGVQLALACDLVLMAEEASFIEIYVRRGIVPDGAAAYLLTRLAGLQRAKELMFLGERVSAAKAREYGLVTEVVPADVLAERTTELAGTLARGPTVAIGMMKRLANRALDADRAAAMFEEAIAQEMVTGTVDAREGIASFLEGRTAEFEGY